MASIAEGIVSSFISSTQITVSLNPTTTGTVGGGFTTSFQFGTDDTSNLANANSALLSIAAVNTGSPASLAIGCGTSIIQQSPFIYSLLNRMSLDVHGCGGEGTAFVIRQDFNYSTGCGTNGGCFIEDDNTAAGNFQPFGVADHFHDMLIYGGGYDASGVSFSNKSGIYALYPHFFDNISLEGWNWAPSQASKFWGVINSGGVLTNVASYVAGFDSFECIAFGSNVSSVFAKVNGGPQTGAGIFIHSGNCQVSQSIFTNGTQPNFLGSVTQDGGVLQSSQNQYVDAFIRGGVAHFTHDNAQAALDCFNSGPTCYVEDSVWNNGVIAAFSGTGTIVNEGHNNFNGHVTINAGGTYVPFRPVAGSCTGVATAASTLGLYGTGPNETLTTCTSVAIGTGVVMQQAGTLGPLVVSATAGGVNASSGVVTVLVNGVASTVTCTLGTGTSCNDVTHTPAYVVGDRISIQFTTQAADTLAGVKAFVETQQ